MQCLRWLPVVLLLLVTTVEAETRVASYFASKMVIQRGRPIELTGYDEPGQEVSIQFDGRSTAVLTDAYGQWSAELPARNAGGPFFLEVNGSTKQIFRDIVIGDVWLCSGQSNMEMPVKAALNGATAAAGAEGEMMRLLHVPRRIALEPLVSLPTEASWQRATEEHLSDFSAVCYFFGLELQKQLRVPIGLITAAWGGTPIESWISGESLKSHRSFIASVQAQYSYRADADSGRNMLENENQSWWRSFDRGPYHKSGNRLMHSPTAWIAIDGPSDFDAIGFADFDGSAWYRASFDASDKVVGKEAILHLGCIDDRDTTWINDELVGTSYKWDIRRRYSVPPGTLREKSNELLIRVLDTGRSGGLVDCSEDLRLDYGDASIRLSEQQWEFHPGRSLSEATTLPKIPYEFDPTSVSVLSNAMIEPLTGFQITGVAWYQGESNSDRAEQYFELLPMLMTDWRIRFQQQLPFLVVQLPGYDDPLRRNWAGLRESQRRAVAADSKAHLIVTIDIGEKDDIHPRNKHEIGKRLALSALAGVYGQHIPANSPSPQSVALMQDDAIVEFQYAYKGLALRGDDKQLEVEVCTTDLNDCTTRFATLRGEHTLIVPDVTYPNCIIRYAWQNFPRAQLENSEKLPAAPFSLTVDECTAH